MKHVFTTLLLGILFHAGAASASLNILATVPEWAALAQEIGGDQVKVSSATTGLQDPHRVEAKPSLIARARNADLLLATGADLEIGWLPLLQRESGNGRIQTGQAGYFEAARHVTMLEIPARVDRADGDVHAGGNPHIQTDARHFLKIGAALTQRLKDLDAGNAAYYDARWRSFSERWRAALTRWETAAAPLKGLPVIVQHRAFPYLSNWLGLREIGSLEAKPGMEASSSHLNDILRQQQAHGVKLVLRPAYQYDAPSRWLAERTKIAVVTLPFTIGGSPEARDLFSLFDESIKRLLAGQQTP